MLLLNSFQMPSSLKALSLVNCSLLVIWPRCVVGVLASLWLFWFLNPELSLWLLRLVAFGVLSLTSCPLKLCTLGSGLWLLKLAWRFWSLVGCCWLNEGACLIFCICCCCRATFLSSCLANSTESCGAKSDVQYFTISMVGTVRGLEKTVWQTVRGTSLQVSEGTSCGRL